jgi:hypothetical protein
MSGGRPPCLLIKLGLRIIPYRARQQASYARSLMVAVGKIQFLYKSYNRVKVLFKEKK